MLQRCLSSLALFSLAVFISFSHTSLQAQWGEPQRKDINGAPLPDDALGRIGGSKLQHGGSGMMTSIKFLPGKNQIATAAGDGFIRIWDATTGDLVKSCNTGVTDPIVSMTLTPDGEYLALGRLTEADSIQVWSIDREQPEPVRNYGAGKAGRNLTLNSEHKYMASNNETTIHIWELRSGSELSSKGMANVDKMLFSPTNPKLLAVLFKDGSVKFMDWTSFRTWETFKDNNVKFNNMAFSKDGNTFYLISDKRLHVYGIKEFNGVSPTSATANNNGLHDLELEKAIGIEAHQDGKQLLISSSDGKIYITDVRGKKENIIETGASRHLLAYSQDGQKIAAGGLGGALKLYNSQTLKPIISQEGHDGLTKEVAFNKDNTKIATASMDGTAAIWDVKTYKRLKQFPHGALVSSIQWSKDEGTLLTGATDGIRKWDVATGELKWHFPIENAVNHQVRFSEDEKIIVSASLNGGFFRINNADGKVILKRRFAYKKVKNDTGGENIVPLKRLMITTEIFALSPDGTLLVVETEDKKGIEGHEMTDGTRVFENTSGTTKTRHLSWAGNSQLFAEALGSKWGLYDNKGRPKIGRPKHEEEPNFVKVGLSHDGMTLAVGMDREQEVWLWHLNTGQEGNIYGGHRGPVDSIFFSKDGKMVTSSTDTTLLFWPAE